jgi:hypothetical protein
MKLPKTKTTLLWSTAISNLTAAGITLAPEDIVWLHTLADRVYHTTPSHRLAFTRAPIAVGPHFLFPITLQALTWLIAIDEWWQTDDLVAAAYACAHSDGQPHPLFLIEDHAQISDAILTWSGTIPLSAADLRQIVAIQTDLPGEQVSISPDPSNTDATNWGELLALLSGVYHIPPWDLLLRPFADLEQLFASLPTITSLHDAVAHDPRRKIALMNFQDAVLFLKKGGTSATVTPQHPPEVPANV